MRPPGVRRGGRTRTLAERPGGQGLARVHGRSGRTCGRGDLSDVRPGLSVEDMLERWGAVQGFGSLAGRLRGARGRWGRRARGRGKAGLQAGGLGRGGAAAHALGGCVRRAATPAAESPRVRFKLLSNSLADLAAGSRGERWRTLLPPPALPFFRASGALKGPVEPAGRRAARRLRVLAKSFQGGSPLKQPSRPNATAKVRSPPGTRGLLTRLSRVSRVPSKGSSTVIHTSFS